MFCTTQFAKNVFANSDWGWINSEWPSAPATAAAAAASEGPPQFRKPLSPQSIFVQPPAPASADTAGLSVAQSLARMWDEVDYGALLLGPASQLLYANHVARFELANGSALRLTPKGVVTQRIGDQAEWQHAINAACLGRRSMVELNSALVVSLAPLRGSAYDDEAEDAPRVIAMLGKRKPCEELSLRMYARLLRLTPAETTVLMVVSEGLSTSEMALRLNVQESTVNTHLKQLRAKAGVHSMRELNSKLSSLPPIVAAVKSLG